MNPFSYLNRRHAAVCAMGCALWTAAATAHAKPTKAREASDAKCTERDFAGKRLTANSFGSVLE